MHRSFIIICIFAINLFIFMLIVILSELHTYYIAFYLSKVNKWSKF
jgi:hypothetical protein